MWHFSFCTFKAFHCLARDGPVSAEGSLDCLVSETLVCWCHLCLSSVRLWRRWGVVAFLHKSGFDMALGYLPRVFVVTLIGCGAHRHGFPTISVWVKCLMFGRAVLL